MIDIISCDTRNKAIHDLTHPEMVIIKSEESRLINDSRSYITKK